MDPRSLSIVLVHYETPELLGACLDSIAAHAPGVDVLVVDNSRVRPAAPVVAAHPGVRLIENRENVGFARAVNQGTRDSSGEWVLVLNPDTRLGPGAVEALLNFAGAHPEAGILAPRLLNPDGTLQHSCRRFYTFRSLLYRRTFLHRWMRNHRAVREHLMLDYDHQSPRTVDWVLGGAMLVRRRAIEDVGGADERFFLYFEDVDWCYRMGRRGWKVWYVPEAVLEHHHRRDSARDLAGLRRHVMSTVRFYEKWSLLLYLAKRSRDRLWGALTVAADLVGINTAFLAAFEVRVLLEGSVLRKPVFPLSYYAEFLLLINLVSLGTLYARGLYRRSARDWADLWVDLLKAMAVACLIVMAATYAAYVKSYSRVLVLGFWPLSVLGIFLARRAVEAALTAAGERLGSRPRAMLIGLTPQLQEATRMVESAASEFEWCGRLDLATVAEGASESEIASRVSDLLRGERVQHLVLALPASEIRRWWEVAEQSREMGADLHMFTEMTPWLRPGDHIEAFGPVRMVRINRELPVESSAWARRALEVTVALVLLPAVLLWLLVSWMWLLIAGAHPSWVREEWDNGRAERVPVWCLASRGGASVTERIGLSRGLLLFWVLTGRLGLVGGPLRPYAEAVTQPWRPLPAGLTGPWFVKPGVRWEPQDIARALAQSDLSSDLSVLVRSAAVLCRRLWTPRAHQEGRQ